MGHDYNLPFGPWGMEAEQPLTLGGHSICCQSQSFWTPRLSLHKSLLQDQKVTMFCTSQHLRHFVERFSEGTLNKQQCRSLCAFTSARLAAGQTSPLLKLPSASGSVRTSLCYCADYGFLASFGIKFASHTLHSLALEANCNPACAVRSVLVRLLRW